jgi:hypothetical protein
MFYPKSSFIVGAFAGTRRFDGSYSGPGVHAWKQVFSVLKPTLCVEVLRAYTICNSGPSAANKGGCSVGFDVGTLKLFRVCVSGVLLACTTGLLLTAVEQEIKRGVHIVQSTELLGWHKRACTSAYKHA